MHRATGLFAAGLLLGATVFAQEPADSLSKTSAAAEPGPSIALRDALAAACAQNERDFARFLTDDSAKVFAQLAPATRVALMKRFVLLDQPGLPQVRANPNGRPLVRCETPSVTTETQLGAANVQENLAFIPIEVRGTGDAAGADARRNTFGLVRESSGWKLLSVGLLLLDLRTLEQQWEQQELEANERDAIEALGRIAAALEKYRQMYGRLPETFAQLGPPEHGAASAAASALLDPDLASGNSAGYAFRYVLSAAPGAGGATKYELAATPLLYGKTGRRSFLMDASGVVRGADRQGALASASDPPLEKR
jgi:hypothetical protein